MLLALLFASPVEEAMRHIIPIDDFDSHRA